MLTLKIMLVPALVALASLLARRYGPAVGGWLVGFPLVAGPILFFLSVDHGVTFGAPAAFGSSIALFSTVLFALVYAWLARRWPWPACLLVAYLVWVANLLWMHQLPHVAWVAVALPVSGLLVGPRLLPTPRAVRTASKPPAWDLPARMLATAALVFTITGLARWLGPTLSGLLTPLPCATTVLTIFHHAQEGPDSVVRLYRGLFQGLYSFVTFCVTAGIALPELGISAGFAAATLAGLTSHGLVLWLNRSTSED